MIEPFGAFAPSPREEAFRRLAHRLPANYFGRRAASFLLGPAGGRSGAPRDVVVFASQRARLHPYDNICEKRVYATPQLWDRRERAALCERIGDSADGVFHFVDVGANAGLYALFARAAALARRKRIRIACIEPDPEMRARLGFNIDASNACADIEVHPYAAHSRIETLRFSPNPASRGLGRLAAEGAITVEGAPLDAIISDVAHFARVDAMKIDIEGGEYDALVPLLGGQARAIRPQFLILETAHEEERRSALALCLDAGYALCFRTRMNAILERRQ